MGSVLLVGGWVELDTDDAYAAWSKKKVAAAKLTGWSAPVDAPSATDLDRLSIDALLTEAASAPEPIEIVRTARGMRFAAAFSSVTGREVWAPALLAAIRRAAAAGRRGGAWALYGDEDGSVLAVDVSGRGAFRALDDDDVAGARAEPEMMRALALVDGSPQAEGALALLPPRDAGADAPPTTSRAQGVGAAPAVRARPAPRARKIPVKLKSSIVGAAQHPSGDVLMIGMFGMLARGNVETNVWTSRALGLGKLGWIAVNGARWWLGTYEGLFTSDDDGATWARRGADRMHWGKPLFVDGAVLAASEGEVLRSTDGGETWSVVQRMADGLGIGTLARAPDGSVVGAGAMGRVVVSRDGGSSFEIVNDGPEEAFNDMTIGGVDVWLLWDTRILRADGAQPGAYVDAGPKRDRDERYACVRCWGGTVWVSGVGKVLRSRDRGASWEILLTEESMFFQTMLPLGPRRLIAAGSDGTAFLVEG